MNGLNGRSSNGGSNGISMNGSTNGNQNGAHKANGRSNGHDPVHMRPRAYVRSAHIIGWGMKIPETVITNADLEAVIETSDEWIRSRTGIQERRIANEREGVVSMGFEAARAALARAYVLPSDLEMIIVATSTPEDIYPSTASKIQNLLGATRAGAFDLSAACSGFVYALNMAAQAIRSGSITTALVIGAEVNSRILDWSDRTTCILFGDGAGAVVLQGRDEPGGWLSCVLGSDGSGADLLGIPSVGYSSVPDGKQLNKLHMNGREVFRFATHVINESIRDALDKAGLTMADVALIIPHQANQRILSAAARSLNVPESLFYSNVHRYGNTSDCAVRGGTGRSPKTERLRDTRRVWRWANMGYSGVPMAYRAAKDPTRTHLPCVAGSARIAVHFCVLAFGDLALLPPLRGAVEGFARQDC
jgi:3-oxoacyl-[acyl-carrier-protein] synthase III